MSQLCCRRVWDGSHEKFRRAVLLLALIDLLVVTIVMAYVGISLYHVSVYEPLDASPKTDLRHVDIHNQTHWENETRLPPCDNDIVDDDECHHALNSRLNETSSRRLPLTPYFAVVGARIAKSIQLIVYTCQLFMTIILIRGLCRTDTYSMRTWLIVTEIITTIILLVLVLYLFGNFHADTVLITGCYLIYQFIMIRTVARFIRRTEIELTQFGSIVEF